mmetsp:Transcript_17650/g.45943  ORF Transcript_17650/g.45943 Transcript_17650/m.45943 type:complete len:215 (+) Transcript_17650:1177-1821(+)
MHAGIPSIVEQPNIRCRSATMPAGPSRAAAACAVASSSSNRACTAASTRRGDASPFPSAGAARPSCPHSERCRSRASASSSSISSHRRSADGSAAARLYTSASPMSASSPPQPVNSAPWQKTRLQHSARQSSSAPSRRSAAGGSARTAAASFSAPRSDAASVCRSSSSSRQRSVSSWMQCREAASWMDSCRRLSARSRSRLSSSTCAQWQRASS